MRRFAAFAQEHAPLELPEAIMKTAPVDPGCSRGSKIARHRPARWRRRWVKGGSRRAPRSGRCALRAALEAIAEMKKVEGAIVGAGTVVNTEQFEAGDEGRCRVHRLAGADRTAGR